MARDPPPFVGESDMRIGGPSPNTARAIGPVRVDVTCAALSMGGGHGKVES